MSALVVGCALHYEKIVQNEHWGYPQEWFPSVSATIGDRYPERSFFMFFIALTSGTRSTYTAEGMGSSLTISRTEICFGWTLVPSHGAVEFVPPKIRGTSRILSNFDLWRMDIRYVDRRSRLARYFHDLVPRCDTTVDIGMFGFEPE